MVSEVIMCVLAQLNLVAILSSLVGVPTTNGTHLLNVVMDAAGNAFVSGTSQRLSQKIPSVKTVASPSYPSPTSSCTTSANWRIVQSCNTRSRTSATSAGRVIKSAPDGANEPRQNVAKLAGMRPLASRFLSYPTAVASEHGAREMRKLLIRRSAVEGEGGSNLYSVWAADHGCPNFHSAGNFLKFIAPALSHAA